MIEIDIGQCLEEELTPSQYCYLKLLWEKNLDAARALYFNDKGLRDSMDHLIELGYVMFFSEETGYSIDKKKCNELFGFEESKFWELFSSYPLKVPDGRGGYRVLRTRDPETKEAKEALKKYKKAIKSNRRHEKVMKCLNLELDSKKRTNSMQFMQQLITWLNQRTWEKYEPLLEDKPKEDERYGEDII